MLPDDMEHYLSEISRTLKPGGRCFITYFLWNDEADRMTRAGKATWLFPHIQGPCRIHSLESPETAVCYDEAFILSLYERYSLDVRQPIYYGNWCGRPEFSPTCYQDAIVAVKR